ncbi:17499_t:CDS:2, partial [Acaulospora morrowiae]
WNILVENLPNTAYTDRSLYFECILSLMTRSEYEEFDRIGSINHIENNDTEIPIEM